MEKLNWLNINELMENQYLVLLWKITWLNSPMYMNRKMEYDNTTGNITTTMP